MNTIDKNRSDERCAYETPIEFSRFSSGDWLEARSVNHSKHGMCIKSNTGFKPGTTVLIRVKTYLSDASCPCAFEGLHSLTLGEIQWCHELTGTTVSSNEIGVKYYPTNY